MQPFDTPGILVHSPESMEWGDERLPASPSLDENEILDLRGFSKPPRKNSLVPPAVSSISGDVLKILFEIDMEIPYSILPSSEDEME